MDFEQGYKEQGIPLKKAPGIIDQEASMKEKYDTSIAIARIEGMLSAVLSNQVDIYKLLQSLEEMTWKGLNPVENEEVE